MLLASADVTYGALIEYLLKSTAIRIIAGAALLCAVLLCACSHLVVLSSETAPSATKLVATADNGYRLTGKELYSKYVWSLLLPLGGTLTDSAAQEFLDSVIVDTLTGFEARTLDLDVQPMEAREYRVRHGNLLSGTYYQRAVLDQVKVDSQKVLDFYEQNKSRLVTKEKIEFSQILVSPVLLKHGPDSVKYLTSTDAQVDSIARRRVDSVYAILQTGADFKKVAEQYSQDDYTKVNGGLVGWTTRGTYPKPFDSVAFQLKVGEYSRPYRDLDGYHIISVGDHLAEGPYPINRVEVYPQVKEIVVNAETQRIGTRVLDSLRQGVKVEFNPAVIDSAIMTAPDLEWYGVVNGRDTFDVLLIRNALDVYMKRHQLSRLTDDQKKEVSDVLIQRALLIEGARAAGFDTLPEIREQDRLLRTSLAKGILIRQWYGPDWSPPDSAVAAYYSANIKRFQIDKPLTVQQIVTKDSVTAEFIRDQASAGVDFLELAKEYYPGDTALRLPAADLGQIGPNDVDSAFFRTALGTNPGQISRPVKTRYGYHIIKVLARKDSKTLEDAKPEIAMTLVKERRFQEFQSLETRLFAKYHVKYPNKIGQVSLESIKSRKK